MLVLDSLISFDLDIVPIELQVALFVIPLFFEVFVFFIKAGEVIIIIEGEARDVDRLLDDRLGAVLRLTIKLLPQEVLQLGESLVSSRRDKADRELCGQLLV